MQPKKRYRFKRSTRRAIVLICALCILALLAGGVYAIGQMPVVKSLRSTLAMRTMLTDSSLAKLDIQTLGYDELLALDGVTQSNDLALFSVAHPIPDAYQPTLAEYKQSGLQMQQQVLPAFEKLAAAVQEGYGEKLYISSAYRTRAQQVDLFATLPQATAPGASEHETGYALDVYVNGFAGENFIQCEAGLFVNRDCWQYGFIIRYGAAKQAHTGIQYEPWHLRYVGQPHAELIMRSGLCLEEYIDYLQPGRHYLFGEYYITRQGAKEFSLPKALRDIHISPDNTGLYIVTGTLSTAKS